MSKFTEWSTKYKVPVWAFFVASAVVVIVALKILGIF